MGKIREFFNLLVIAVLISLSIIFIGAAFREEYPLWKNQKILEDLRSDVKAEETGDGNPGIDWEKLKKINPDIVGWIKVPGTKIDYPVLQGSRWNEYLHKDYKGEYCYAGSIFLQPETSFMVIICVQDLCLVRFMSLNQKIFIKNITRYTYISRKKQ